MIIFYEYINNLYRKKKSVILKNYFDQYFHPHSLSWARTDLGEEFCTTIFLVYIAEALAFSWYGSYECWLYNATQETSKSGRRLHKTFRPRSFMIRKTDHIHKC